MTGLEVIPKISELLIDLISRVQDRHTAALVGQIQTMFQTLQKDYIQGQQDLLSASRRAFQAEQDHAKAMKEAEASHAATVSQLNAKLEELKGSHTAQVSALQQQIQQLEAQNQKPASKEWSDAAKRILVCLFRAGRTYAGLSQLRRASELSEIGMFEHTMDQLGEARLISRSMPSLGSWDHEEESAIITSSGRELVANSGWVSA